MALGLVAHIAASTMGRWLAAEKIRPWRFHNWQHILDPRVFLERARPVLELYNHAREWLEQGVWIVCADEKTSIQARERQRRQIRPYLGTQSMSLIATSARERCIFLVLSVLSMVGLVGCVDNGSALWTSRRLCWRWWFRKRCGVAYIPWP